MVKVKREALAAALVLQVPCCKDGQFLSGQLAADHSRQVAVLFKQASKLAYFLQGSQEVLPVSSWKVPLRRLRLGTFTSW